MKNTIKRIAILLVIFIAAVAIYFIWSKRENEHLSIVYSAAEKATLPVIYPETLGRRMNMMLGYRQEMGQAAARDSLTILPEDRQLTLHIEEAGNQVVAARFEIRSLDLERLVERTEIEQWDQQDEISIMTLPIQNLLTRNAQYLMIVELDTELYGTVFYYTRIMWTDETIAKSMVDLAAGFSAKTFNYDQARELVTYLETNDTEDNSSFGAVTIRSSFAQLTWGKLKMRAVGDVEITLKEADGIMGTVQLRYLAERDSEEGDRELYDVEESFTMKWNQIRTYMMDYYRNTNQLFTGTRSAFTGKRIMLGITNDSEISAQSSSSGEYQAFVAGRELWSYQQDKANGRTVKVFSFRGDNEQDVRTNCDRHAVRVLSVEDSGDITFLVYGYMNRGANEGQTGVAAYRYDNAENAVGQLFFIPVSKTYEQLKADVEQLKFLTGGNMFYCFIDRAVYGIDLKSNEHMTVADGLTEGSYAISADGSQLAWQEGGSLYDSDLIHWMDLGSGKKSEIRSEAGEKLRTLGFVGQDLVYGIANAGDEWISNGRVRELPLKAIEILNGGQQVESRYEKSGKYLSEVVVSDSRIHVKQIVRQGAGDYIFSEEDTIVCNEPVGAVPMAGIGWYASQDKGKLYFVQLSSEIRSNAAVKMTTPRRVDYTQSEQLVLQYQQPVQQRVFHAYGGGHYLGSSGEFAEALKLAYDKMGIVVDQNHQMVWNRVNRANLHNIRNAVQAAGVMTRYLDNFETGVTYPEGITMIDARGCTLNQILYFIDQGCPVAAYEGSSSYRLLSGYDQYNITITDPVTGMTEKMGLNDGAEYFRLRGNDFVCGILKK